MDLPTYLSTLPLRNVEIKTLCPHCSTQSLHAIVEPDTNATVETVCDHCHWSDEQGCPDKYCPDFYDHVIEY